MTISSTNRKAGPYIGAGTTAAFPFYFKVFQASDLEVVKLNVSSGIETTLALTTDYTVTLNGDQNSNAGGTITLVAGNLATGYNLVITSSIANLQQTDLTNQGGFYPEVITDALDRATIQIQQLQEGLNRAALLPITSSADAAALVADIERLATSADNIDTVAGSISNVNTVASNISSVNTVAGNTSNINTVAGISSNVTTVAGNSTNINTVATNIASVNSAATNMAAIIAAPSNAASAAASAAAAAASAASGLYSAVQDKSANYTVVADDAGDLLRITTTSGPITITLPLISSLSDGFKVAIVKWTADSNAVTITRSGSDTINGATSASIGSQYTQTTFVADFETNQWFAATSGLGSTNVVIDSFNGTGSQTAFTLSGDAGTKNNTDVYISGVHQDHTTYSLSGTTLTFSTAPPTGSGNIEVVWTQPLPVGVPSDGTVTTAKIVDANVTAAKLAANAVTTAKILDANVTLAKLSATGTPSSSNFLRGDNTWAAAGTGTVTSITAGTGLSGGTITTSGTIALVTTAGAIGTYVVAIRNNAFASFGSTIAGSSLQPSTWGNTCAAYGTSASGTLSGTWQLMGVSNAPFSSVFSGLYVRIA